MIEKLIYNYFALPLGIGGFWLYSLFNSKAKKGWKARANILSKFETELSRWEKEKRILLHISSVGEYLQARAVLRELKRISPKLVRILTFFSPSLEPMLERGVEAELASYLPFDTPQNMKRLLEIITPNLIIFSCYDLWPNLIWQAKKRGIKVVLINATLAENSFKRNFLVRWWFARLYNQLDLILCASDEDKERIISLGVDSEKVSFAGNTRFSETLARINAIAPNDELLAQLKIWKGERYCLVVGSSWEPDEQVLIPAYKKIYEKNRLKLILAPHEPHPKRIEKLKDIFRTANISSLTLSELEQSQNKLPKSWVIIVDSVGKLYKLYKVGDIAFVGGSFRKEVHNVMEPAGFGIPVLLGPKIKNSQEALKLVERGGAKIVHNSDQLCQELELLLNNNELRKNMGGKAYRLVEENQQALERTIKHLQKNFPELFTND